MGELFSLCGDEELKEVADGAENPIPINKKQKVLHKTVTLCKYYMYTNLQYKRDSFWASETQALHLQTALKQPTIKVM